MNRNTKQRQIIYDVVLKHMDHPDAETIYNDVIKIDKKISKGTVYRNLNLLASQGLIRLIKVPGGNRFDFNTINHNHIVCKRCGKVIDSPIKYDDKIDKKIEEETGFKIVSHQVLFEALCKDCLNILNKEGNEDENL